MSSIRLMARRYRLPAVIAAAVILTVGTSAAVRASAARPDQAPPACAAGTDVTTTTGPVCGIVNSSNGVSEWLAIPYAAPPVGALRWEPPQPHASWTTTLQATAYGPECEQQDAFGTVLPLQGSEDCLFVNVFRPAGATASSNLPVMVHIHGGGFRIGNGQGDYSLLASTGDEVVVSLQYRLGIFGFLADPALGPHSGDYGLQDQQAALRWVQENIAAFGGNPDHVTIFGESAGASSVCDQIASPTAAGLFEGAISTSGEYDGLFGVPGPGETLEVQDCKSALPTEAQADSLGASYAAALGCGSGSPAAVAACLRSAPAADVAETAGYGGYQYGGHGTIAPTINGSTLTMTLRQALRTGHVNRVAVIAGVGRDEDLVSNETGVALPTTAAGYTALVESQYGRYAPRILAMYPLSRYYSPYVAFRTVAADSDTVCPALVTDRELARYMPVYGYEMDDGDPPPNTQTVPAGAQHASDPWDLTPVTGLDANMQVLQQQEIGYVTTFARTGNPTTQNAPVWPEFRSGYILSLAPGGDSEAMPIAVIEQIHNCGFWDQIAPHQGGGR
jgi:para-nitrobenzyl esterase